MKNIERQNCMLAFGQVEFIEVMWPYKHPIPVFEDAKIITATVQNVIEVIFKVFPLENYASMLLFKQHYLKQF